MKKTILLLMILQFALSSFAQSKGEKLFFQAEKAKKEMYLNTFTHSIDEVTSLYSKALDQLYREENNDLTAKVLCCMGELKMSKPELSRSYYERAKNLTIDSGSVVEMESDICYLMWEGIIGSPISAWDRAKKYLSRIDSIKDTVSLVRCLNILATIAGRAGDMKETNRLFNILLAIDCSNNEIATIYQINGITDYSDLLVSYGLFAQSLSMMTENCIDKELKLFEKGYYPQNWGRFLYSMAISLKNIDDEIDEAIDDFRMAIDFYIKVFGEDYIELIHARKQLASTLILNHEYEAAYKELDLVISQVKELYGDTHQEMMTTYATYSWGYMMNLRLEEARDMAIESVRIANAIESTSTMPYQVKALTYWLMRDYSNMLISCNDLLNVCKRYIHYALTCLPENDWESFWISNGAAITSTVARASMNVSDDNGLLYNASLFSKGLLLRASNRLGQIISGDETGRLKELLEECRNLYAQADFLEGGDKESVLRAKKLRQEAHDKEFKLMSASTELNDYIQESDYLWQDVEKALGDDEAAIEFIRYEDSGQVIQYAASVLRHGIKPINIAFPDLTDEYIVYQAKEQAYLSTDFFKKTIALILPYLEDCKTIWYSPAGALSSVALENIKVSRNQYASDLFGFRRLSSTRNVIYRKPENKWETAVLFGGLDYDLSSEEIEYYAETSSLRRSESLHDWTYLKGSLEEVKTIYGLLDGVYTDIVTAGEGVKERFKMLSGKRTTLIHIATHGFYHDDVTELVGNEDTGVEDFAMLTSGLVFSGANNKDNGLMSAAEISQMDLSGCELAVLSACGTGLTIINYDESYGLIRAFKKAGCKSLLVTLWDIDDSITKFFMEEFYKAKKTGENNTSALDRAKRATRKKYPSPKNWAGFILID